MKVVFGVQNYNIPCEFSKQALLFRSICTNFGFAQIRLRLGNAKSKNFVFRFAFRSICTNFAADNVESIEMRKIAYLASALMLALLAACGSVNESLEKMIPADATGVVSIDVPSILKKAQLEADGRIVLPADLSEVIDGNDGAALCQALTDLPVMGVNTEAKAYAFFTDKTFGSVLLVPLADEKAARATVSARLGEDFADVEGLSCVATGDKFVAIADGVLMAARVARAAEVEKLARAARAMFDRKSPSIVDVDHVKDCLAAEGDVNAYFQLKGLKQLLRQSKTYRELAQRLPLVEIFTESDIEAVTCKLTLNERDADLETHFKVGESSDYIKLMNATMSNPDAKVLKVIPSSMDYVLSMSVKGDQLVQLPQIDALLAMFAKLPHIGKFDLKAMLSTIDGPVAVSMAPDPYLEGDWNGVIAASSKQPDQVVASIASFAMALGQAPELYDNEYVYQYENKMIKVGVNDGVIYLKMLNYEQTEGYASDNAALAALFASSPLAITIKTKAGKSEARFSYGLTNHVDGHGTFVPAPGEPSATLALLKALCAIKPAAAYDDMLPPADDQDTPDYLPEGVKLKPVR